MYSTCVLEPRFALKKKKSPLLLKTKQEVEQNEKKNLHHQTSVTTLS
jgi:hypothetical protein